MDTRKLLRVGALGCLVLLAAGLLAPRARPAGRPNVLLVTIDTLRADAVGRDTPAIESFLASATRYRRARTVAPLTLPAHVSMFTGLFPPAHAIHDNVTEPLPPPGERPFPLLAERFRERGYRTAAFVASAVLAPATGLGAGFDIYDCPERPEGQLDEGPEIAGEERVRAAIRWTGSETGPWFAWVHLYDPHAPYVPFPGDASHAPTSAGDPPFALYAGEVRRADAAFGALLSAVPADTVVVLASDHGEGLGDHGESEHGPLCHAATVDAVLAVRGPGFRPGADDAGLRSVADVAPTLARLCGLAEAPADGRDLRGPPHATLVAESLFTWRIHGWGQCFAATDGECTLVESGPRLELFDVRADPGETRPLGLSVAAYEKLDRALERYRALARGGRRAGPLLDSTPPYGTERRPVSGYLPRHENARLLDPREHLGTWMAMETVPGTVRLALARRDRAALERALDLLADLEETTPTSPRVPHYRAGICAALAEVTGDRSWLSCAARAELDSIRKGYTRKTVREAIRLAVEARDADALRSFLRIRRCRRLVLDAEAERALGEAVTTLGVEHAGR